MATSPSQDGVKKKRKPQRALIAPALPLNLNPKPAPTAPISIGGTGVHNPDYATKEAGSVVTALKEKDPGIDTGENPEKQSNLSNLTQTAAISPDDPLGREESINVKGQPTKQPTPDTLKEDTSQEVAAKADLRADLSHTQSPTARSSSAGPHTNGITSENPENSSPANIEHLNFQLQHDYSALNATGQTARDQSTIMPQRYFNNEEPILDWADEMSEEMPPDTLHIPSVPHLPELSSDATASEPVNFQGLSLYTNQVQPLRPTFGSAATQELQSEEVVMETPKRDGQRLTNGYSHDLDPKAAISDYNIVQYQTGQTMTSLQNGHARGTSQPFVARGPIPDMTTHLTKLFETRDLVDWTIHVIPPNGSYLPVAYPTHGVVISRSEVLRFLMGIRLHVRPMNPVITLSPPRYVLPPAFEAALKYLYNDAILTPAACTRYFTFNENTTPAAVKSYQLDFCFSYWLSGHILGIAAVVDAGVELLKEYLDWDTVEMMIKESLEVKKASSAHHFSLSPNGAIISPSTPSDPSSPLSSRQNRSTATGVDEYEILGVLVDSLATGKLKVDLSKFNLDTSPSHVLPSYLPDEQQYTKAHRGLASITFGSLPTTTPSTKTHARSGQPVFSSSNSSGNAQSFSSSERALSAILLNVPLAELNEFLLGLLQSFGENEVMDLFAKVLQEREVRRVRVAESDWYRSEVAAKRRLHQVECTEELVRDGKRSYLVSRLNESTTSPTH